ncbi:MAG: hypothetical protein U0797_23835 [Gemmataceae bacterium]
MCRTAVLLCCCSLLAVTAAPPPPVMWVTGWDRPVNPHGYCRFDRAGSKLTITVPGDGHELDVRNDRLNAPRLLKDVEGDFAAQVRVTGDFTRAGLTGSWAFRRTGLLVTH